MGTATPFADNLKNTHQAVGHGAIQTLGGIPMAGGSQAAAKAPAYSNILKRFANWNVCFLC